MVIYHGCGYGLLSYIIPAKVLFSINVFSKFILIKNNNNTMELIKIIELVT